MKSSGCLGEYYVTAGVLKTLVYVLTYTWRERRDDIFFCKQICQDRMKRINE